MSDYITFEARITPLLWGDKIFTICPLPDDVVQALNGAKRVEGEFADHPVNLALGQSPELDRVFLWAGQSLLDATGLSPGECFEARLRPADPKAVDTPADVTAALMQHGLVAAWEALTAGKRRALMYQISTAKRVETRAKRIKSLIETLS
ncbi:MAG: YdeI/OmpD-associated family protein [Pseudomonadota bacterium]